MTPTATGFPRFRPVADHAVLVEFGEVIGRAVHDQVRRLDSALARLPFDGFTEAVPANTNVLVSFDPLVTDHRRVEAALSHLVNDRSYVPAAGATREVLICYDDDLAPDLEAVAEATGLTPEAVIAAHLAGDYSVYMYGFAPGYAYLAGVPKAIQLPRKPAAIRDMPAGSLVMAGPQCLVTTLKMPTGWWIIGRSPTRMLRDGSDHPFFLDIGDKVIFRRIDRATFDKETGHS